MKPYRRPEPPMNVPKLPYVLPALLVLAMAACGDAGGPAWVGTMRDSAGIAIIENTMAGLWSDSELPEVEEVLRIGSGESDSTRIFGDIVGADVDELGNIYVMDQQTGQVKVFDARGAFLRTVGRPGSGPGEFGPGTVTVLVHGDRVIVPDLSRQRVNLFTREGKSSGSFALDARQGIAYQWAVGHDGGFVHQSRAMPAGTPAATSAGGSTGSLNVLVSRAVDGAILDTLLTLPSGEAIQGARGGPQARFFGVEPLWAVDEAANLLVVRNDAVRISVYAANGSLERIITRPEPRISIAEEDRAAILDAFAKTFDSRGMPPTVLQNLLSNAEFTAEYPAVHDVFGGPQETIWVQRVRRISDAEVAVGPEAIGSPEWLIFGPQGRYLGALRLPDGFKPYRLADDRLYGAARDDRGVEYLSVLRIGQLKGAS